METAKHKKRDFLVIEGKSRSILIWLRRLPCFRVGVVLRPLTSSKDECVNMSSWPMVMRGGMMEVGGVMGVMAGDGPSDSSTSLSGLSSDTSSVASVGSKAGSTVSSRVVLRAVKPPFACLLVCLKYDFTASQA